MSIPDTEASAAPVRAPRGSRYALWVAVGLACAWVLPLVTQALAVDWVLPIVLWFALASLLRSGRTVLDRLIVALGLLLGATVTAGLVISLWPWGLAPVPVAGVAFSALVVIAALMRRGPELPTGQRGTDLVTVGLSALSLLAIFWPYRQADAARRFAIIAAGGDYASHFTLYDAIRGVGGYVFMNRPQTAGEVWSIYQTYPQGPHFIAALLASFLRSDATQAHTAWGELTTFVWFEPATYVLLCLAVLWSIRWLAGPSLRPLLALPLATLGLSYLLFGDPLEMLWSGYWPEILGLAEFSLLVAVLCRPLPRVREQILLVVSLVVAICYTYFLMLPVVAVAVLFWLLLYRRRLVGHRIFLAIAAVLGGFSAGVMLYVNLIAFPASDHLTVSGSILHPDDRILLCFTFLVLTAVGVGARRSPVWRGYLLAMLATVALVLGIAGYHEYKLGELGYFFYKAEHVLMIVAILGVGSLAPLAGRLVGRVRPTDVRRWAGAVVPSLALAVASFVALGPYFGPSFSRMYEDGDLAWTWPAYSALRVAAVEPQRSGVVTLVWVHRQVPAHATHWSNVLLRDEGRGWQAQMWVGSGQTLEQLFVACPYRIRVVTDDAQVINDVRATLTRRPDLAGRVELVQLALPK